MQNACTISIAIAISSILRKNKHKLVWLVLVIALALFSIIPAKIAIAFHQTPIPQAIFVLGGNSQRMEFAAQFWRSHRNLDIITIKSIEVPNRNWSATAK